MQIVFSPPRKQGLLLHILSLVLELGGGTFCMLLASQESSGGQFAGLLFLGLIFYLPAPLIAYRIYSLWTASYTIERDGLRLRWGLRAEDIPLQEIEWVRPANEMGFALKLPFWRVPGAIIGSRTMEELGTIEYLASDHSTLLLIATNRCIYVISPADANGFIRAFQRAAEMGSLTPIDGFSSRPVAFLRVFWEDPVIRIPLLAGLGANLLLFIITVIKISIRTSVTIGFTISGQPAEPVSAERLLLFPVLAGMSFLITLIGGLFFYRKEEQRPAAYLLFLTSPLLSILLSIAVLFFS